MKTEFRRLRMNRTRRSKLIYFQGLLFLLASAYHAPIAHAQPYVQSHNGTVAHSNSITIYGSDFGVKTNSAPVAFGDMENGSISARIGSWTQTGYPSGLMTTSTVNQRNSNSTRNAVCTIPTSGNATCGFEGGSDARQWYVQYWFYLDPTSFNWGSNNKIFRMWTTGSGANNLRIQIPINKVDIVVEGADTSHGGYGVGWTPVVPGGTCTNAIFGHSCNYNDFLAGSVGWDNVTSDLPKGSWHLFQFEYQDSDINAANGVLRWWVNGKLVFSHSDVRTRTSADPSYKRPKVVGIYSSNSGDASGRYHIDDAYIDNTWHRVEIGNNPVYDSCSLREIQPVTSWENSAITFTVNQGSFANGATGYVFVTDSNGVRNSGYQITFGSSGSSSVPATISNVSATVISK